MFEPAPEGQETARRLNEEAFYVTAQEINSL